MTTPNLEDLGNIKKIGHIVLVDVRHTFLKNIDCYSVLLFSSFFFSPVDPTRVTKEGAAATMSQVHPLFESVRSLHENQLWTNLIALAPFALPMCR